MTTHATSAPPRLIGRRRHILREPKPGEWGDRLVFGYMFRVITALAAVFVPGVLVLLLGALNRWHLTEGMIWFFGIAMVLLILIGETLRIGAYESRLRNVAFERIKSEMGMINLPAMIVKIHGEPPLSYRISKRLFDIFFSALVLAAITPLFLMIALLIKFDSRGPATFSQRRLGYRNRWITIHKFRTMYAEPQADPSARITRVGRFLRATAIDELPQLFDVLVGHMSLVGPRPATPLGNELSDILCYAKPGLTGIAAPRLSAREAFITYLTTRSLWVDFVILVRTFARGVRIIARP